MINTNIVCHTKKAYTHQNTPLRDHCSYKMGIGIANGTFGELLQGVLPNDHNDFLVTLPIDCYSKAYFVADSEAHSIEVVPIHKTKSQILAKLLLEHHQMSMGGKILIKSDLLIGKGLASSSADLVATARAIEAAIGKHTPERDLHNMLYQIEPTDGVMYPGVVSFYHRKVKLNEFIGNLPPLEIIAIDEGGIVDTCAYNQSAIKHSKIELYEFKQLLENISMAIQNKDMRLLGKITTRSAILNQKINPKRTLIDMIKICQSNDALGVVVAHSGTYIGILLDKSDPQYVDKKKQITRLLKTISGSIAVFNSLDFEKLTKFNPFSDLEINSAMLTHTPSSGLYKTSMGAGYV